MLNLKEYIKESILDDEDAVFDDVRIKLEIKKFIEEYKTSHKELESLSSQAESKRA